MGGWGGVEREEEVSVSQPSGRQSRVEVRQGGVGLTQVGQQVGHLFIHLVRREHH